MESAGSSRASGKLIPWAFWVAGMFLAFTPVLLSGFESLQVYAGDPRLVNYILEHSWRWLCGGELHGSFWSPPAFYPAQGVGAYSDTLVGSAPFYWVWRWFGIAPGVSFQLWMMVALSLNYWAAHLFLARCLRVPVLPAALGALLFGFANVRLASFNSPQMFPIFYATFALFALHRALAPPQNAGRWSGLWILAFFAALSAQAWSAFYASFFFVLLVAIGAASGLAFEGSRRRIGTFLRQHFVATAVGATGALLTVLPLARAHLDAAAEVGWRGVEAIVENLPPLQSWVFLGETNAIYGGLANLDLFTFRVHPSQYSNGPGLVTGLVALVGLVCNRRRPLVALLFAASVVTAVIMTRLPNGFSVWEHLVPYIPGARALRYPARIGMFLPFVTAVGVALFFTRPPRPALAWLLGLACVAEQVNLVPALDESRYWHSVDRVVAEIDPDAEAFVVKPLTGPRNRAQPRVVHLVAMWAALEAQVPTINGFYGKSPKHWRLMSVSREDLGRWLRAHHLPKERVQWIEAPAEWFQLRE